MVGPGQVFLYCTDMVDFNKIPPKLKRFMLWTFPISFPIHLTLMGASLIIGSIASVLWMPIWFPLMMYRDD